jgi:cell division protein DivIC
MTFLKKILNNKIFKFLTNRYVLILLVFTIWMLFFDENSFLNHREFDNEIEELENSIEFYKTEIEQNKKMIETLKDTHLLKKFAREKFYMKKDNETLFLIEFDTLN